MSVLFLLRIVSLNGTIDESHLNKTQSNPKFAIYFGKKHLKALVEAAHKNLSICSGSASGRSEDRIIYPTPWEGRGLKQKAAAGNSLALGEPPPHCKQAAQHLSLCKPAGSAKADRCARNQALQQCVTWGERREYTELCCKCAGHRSKLKNMNSLGLR